MRISPGLRIVSRLALMRAAVDANGITEMQSIWGGTHDMLLATLLFMYKIPLFSVRSVYYGGSMVPISKENMNWVSFDRSKVVFVHMLKNFAIPMKRGMNNTRTYKQIPGMLDAAKAFGDDILYRHVSYMASSKRLKSTK